MVLASLGRCCYSPALVRTHAVLQRCGDGLAKAAGRTPPTTSRSSLDCDFALTNSKGPRPNHFSTPVTELGSYRGMLPDSSTQNRASPCRYGFRRERNLMGRNNSIRGRKSTKRYARKTCRGSHLSLAQQGKIDGSKSTTVAVLLSRAEQPGKAVGSWNGVVHAIPGLVFMHVCPTPIKGQNMMLLPCSGFGVFNYISDHIRSCVQNEGIRLLLVFLLP